LQARGIWPVAKVLTKGGVGGQCFEDLNSKVIIALVAAGALVGGALFVLKHRSGPPVTVTLRIAVAPGEQVGFVTGRANSAQFKYLVGKQSGVKPVLAQKLLLQSVPNSAVVEARIRVLTADEGRRYVEAFVPTLQDLCGGQARLSLAAQSVR
jgi:hypothetical protein